MGRQVAKSPSHKVTSAQGHKCTRSQVHRVIKTVLSSGCWVLGFCFLLCLSSIASADAGDAMVSSSYRVRVSTTSNATAIIHRRIGFTPRSSEYRLRFECQL